MSKLTEHLRKKNNQYELNYLQIRRSVGWLGILLPIIVVSGTLIFCSCAIVKDSISNYYYTAVGNVFTGILCGVALFLYSYNGFDKWDDYSSSLASVTALGVAFFPMNVAGLGDCEVVTRIVEPWRNKVHYGSAAGLFITLALMSLFLFVKTDHSKKPTKQKLQRNLIYRLCGIIMLVCCALTFLIQQHLFPDFQHSTLVFESIMLWAFGFSWLVKGQTILKDS